MAGTTHFAGLVGDHGGSLLRSPSRLVLSATSQQVSIRAGPDSLRFGTNFCLLLPRRKQVHVCGGGRALPNARHGGGAPRAQSVSTCCPAHQGQGTCDTSLPWELSGS